MIPHDWVFATLIPILLLLLLPCRHSQVSAALANVTVDDSGLDPLTGSRIMYLPSDVWKFGQNCTTCTARPDPTQAFMQSWHDGTFLPDSNNNSSTILTATFQFQGSAIYVFCIVPPQTFVPPSGNPDMTFLIDGQPVKSFAQSSTGATNYDFNVPVYVNASLPDGMHTFTLENGHVNGTKSLVLLDYIVYTTSVLASGPPPSWTPVISPGTSFPTQTFNTSPTTSSISALNGAGVTLSTGTPFPSASTVQQVSGNSSHSLTSRDRTIIIVACSVGGLLILLSIGLAIYYFHRRQYNDDTAPDINASGSTHISEETVRFVPNRHPDLIHGASASAITSTPEDHATEGSGGSDGDSVGGSGSSGNSSGGVSTSGVSIGGGAQLRPLSPGRRPRPLAMVLDPNGRQLDVGENSRPSSYYEAVRPSVTSGFFT